MAGEPTPAQSERATESWSRLEGWRLDVAFSVLALWMTVGVTLDFRVHSQGISFAEEGFFTTSHVVFYTAFLAIALLLGATTYAERRRGADWVAAIPDGYRLGLLGVFLFALGGPGDFLWHNTFGFEQGVEALTSPTHLLLATGAGLFLTSPLRAAWHREVDDTLRAQFPAFVSATLMLTVIAFFTLYGNPLANPLAGYSTEYGGRALGVLSIVTFGAIVTGFALVLLRGFRLAPGAFTLSLGGSGTAISAVGGTFQFVPSMVLTGLVADVLVRALRPDPGKFAWRTFAVAVPLTFAGSYIATVELTTGIVWSTHVWAGAVASAGLAGLLVSYVATPSALADR